ncbi:hypothetical protein V8E53_000168 [Lactarius tabidus]
MRYCITVQDSVTINVRAPPSFPFLPYWDVLDFTFTPQPISRTGKQTESGHRYPIHRPFSTPSPPPPRRPPCCPCLYLSRQTLHHLFCRPSIGRGLNTVWRCSVHCTTCPQSCTTRRRRCKSPAIRPQHLFSGPLSPARKRENDTGAHFAERRQKNGPVQCHLVIEKTVENDHPLPPYPLDHFTSQKRGQRDLKFRLMQKALSHGLCE